MVTQIVNPWPKNLDGTLNLAKAPFRLVAVVYRGDLAQNLVYGGGSAGEARLVFALTDPNTCAPRRFLVIFEYGIQQPSCVARKAWGQAWFDLKNNQVGSPAYNAALEALTVQFTEAGTNPSQFPNQSSLNQLRTNELVISPSWELREFHLAGGDADVGHLRETTIVRTPDFPLNDQFVTADFINQHAAAILNDTYSVDAEFPIGTPLPRRGRTGSVPAERRILGWAGTASERRDRHAEQPAQVLAQHLQRLPRRRDGDDLHAHQRERRALRLLDRHHHSGCRGRAGQPDVQRPRIQKAEAGPAPFAAVFLQSLLRTAAHGALNPSRWEGAAGSFPSAFPAVWRTTSA